MSGASTCILGNVSIDDLVFADGTTRWRVPGGNAIYAALGVAVWAGRPAIIAPCGTDYPEERLAGRVDLTHCRRTERTLRNWGLYEEDGSRSFVFRRHTRDWQAFSPTANDVSGSWQYGHIAPLPWHLQQELAVELRAHGAQLISLDLDDRHLTADQGGSLRALLARLDLFLPSRQDTEALFPGTTPLEAMRRIRDLAPDLPVIAVKCGADGVMLHDRDSADYLAIPSIAGQVADPTGAGDAFCGGMLAGLADTGSAQQAALRGSVSASFAVEALGPDGLVAADRDEALKRLTLLQTRVRAATF